MPTDDRKRRHRVTSDDVTHPGTLYGIVYSLSDVQVRISLFARLAAKRLTGLPEEEQTFLAELMDRTAEELQEIRSAIGLYAHDAWPRKNAFLPLKPLVEAGVAMARNYGSPHVQLDFPDGLPDIHAGIGQVEQCVANVLVRSAFRLSDRNEKMVISASEETLDREGEAWQTVRLRFEDNGTPLEAWKWLELFCIKRFGPEGTQPLVPLHLASSLPWFEATGEPHNTLDLYWRTEDESRTILEKLGLEKKADS